MSVILRTVTYCEERNMAEHRPGLQGNFQSIFPTEKKVFLTSTTCRYQSKPWRLTGLHMGECDSSTFIKPMLNGGDEHKRINGGNYQN